MLNEPNTMPGREGPSMIGTIVSPGPVESGGGGTVVVSPGGVVIVSPGEGVLSIGATAVESAGGAASERPVPSLHAAPMMTNTRRLPSRRCSRVSQFGEVDKPFMSVASPFLGASTPPPWNVSALRPAAGPRRQQTDLKGSGGDDSIDLETARGRELYVGFSVPLAATVAMEWTPG